MRTKITLGWLSSEKCALLRLRGRWLKELFSIGDRLEVRIVGETIVISKGEI